MTYEPLHHKYRPQTFAELVGQEAIAATLTNALRQQRIAPAYLFTGARGTGKTSSARILAKSLNCQQTPAPTETPCGRCEVCRSIASGSALDVIEIDAASNTGVDNIRELIERAQFAPVQCRYKVYIIDEVHMLSTAAFNALLKTLEEPPDRVVFVLATTDPQRVLATIISRCQRFDFRRIPLTALVQHLETIADKEAIDITGDALQLVGQISQGGLRDAESLLDQLSLLEGQITVERVWDLVGAVPERDLLALLKAIAQEDATLVIDRSRHLMDRGREPLIVLQNLASFYRDLLIAKTSPDRGDLVAITPPTWAELCEFAATLEIQTILRGQQHLRESEVQIRNTTQPRLWLEVTLMGLLPSMISPSTPATTPPLQAIREAPVRPSPSTPPSRPSPLPEPVVSAPPATIPEPPAIVESRQPISQAPPSVKLVAEEVVAEEVVANINLEPSPPSIVPPASTPKLEPEPTPVTEAPQTNLDHNLDQIWQDVLLRVQPFSTRVMLQQQCLLLSFKGQEARIGARSEKLFKMAKERLPNIEAAFEMLVEQKVKVSLEVATSAEAQARPAGQIAMPENGSPASQSPNISKPIVRESPPPFAAGQGDRPPTPSPHPVNGATNSSNGTAPPAPTELVTAADVGAEEPFTPPSWQAEDDVSRAAKSFAQMFNGQIVSLDDDLSIAPGSGDLNLSTSSLSLAEADSGDPDDDVPF